MSTPIRKMTKNILITGGSGLVGTKLTTILTERGYSVRHLGRKKKTSGSTPSYNWSPEKDEIDQKAIEWADTIVHLAGAGIAEKKWTSKRKKVLRTSRIKTAELLKNAISNAQNKPQQIISASGISYYGLITTDTILEENSPHGDDFIAQLCIDWEKPIISSGIQNVVLRIGIVLSENGGALTKMTAAPLLSPLGSGQQWMPWIHIDDLCNMFLHAIENQLEGIFNAVSPEHVNNHYFTHKLCKAAGKVFLPIKAPAFVLKIALGDMADLLLEGTRISPEKMKRTGFIFQFEQLDNALKNIYT